MAERVDREPPKCIEAGCQSPALLTERSFYWCEMHNLERIKRIDDGFAAALRRLRGASDG